MLPQWYYDLNEPMGAIGVSSKASQVSKYEKPAFFKTSRGAHVSGSSVKRARVQEDDLKLSKAWQVAIGPAKNLPTNLIMSWFSGSNLQIMTISMTAYMFFINPLKEAMLVQEKFRLLEGKHINSSILVYKFIYVLCNLLAVAAGVYKVKQMGLLPDHSSDWSAFEEPARYHY